MFKIPVMSSKKFIKLLEKGGARFVRQQGTSHAIYERIMNNKVFRAPVLTAKQELSPKYTKMVFKQLGFIDFDMNSLLKR